MKTSKPSTSTKSVPTRATKAIAYATVPRRTSAQSAKQSTAHYESDTGTQSLYERALFSGLLAQKLPANDLDIVNWVHNRLPLDVIDRMLDEGITKQELTLIAPQRTLAHRRTNGEALTVEESDRAVRLARVIAQAEAVLGSKEKALAWLRRTFKRFAGRTPLQMLASDVGSRMVEEALVQIDEGFFA